MKLKMMSHIYKKTRKSPKNMAIVLQQRKNWDFSDLWNMRVKFEN